MTDRAYDCPHCGTPVTARELVQHDDPAGIAFPWMHPDPDDPENDDAWCGPVVYTVQDQDTGTWAVEPAQGPPRR